MNQTTRPIAILKPFNYNNYLKLAVFFHSTPVLDRKRRTHWNSQGGGSDRDSTKRYNRYTKRCRKFHSKEELLRNVGVFAEQLFENWRAGNDDKDRWFRREFDVKSSKGGCRSTNGPYSTDRTRGFNFCDNDDDSDVETIFRGSFGGAGPQFFFFPFGSRTSWSKNSRTAWSRSDEDEDEDDDISSEPDCSKSDRQALGLCPSGPLKIEDVKNAYRVCALKWHPDRHAGKTKAVAEEKFKACSAAYQSLCDKLSPA